MKYLCSLLLLVILSKSVHSQSSSTIQPYLDGYKQSEIIKYDDFIKNGKLTTTNDDYRVVGFTLMVWAGIVQEFKSDSCTLTDEMKKVIMELKSKGIKTSKIYFHDIKVRNPKGEIKITEDLIYKLKLN